MAWSDRDLPSQDMMEENFAPPLARVLLSLHYAYPTVVFIYYMVSSAIAICTLQTAGPQDRPIQRQRRLITGLLTFGILTYVAQCLNLLVQHLLERRFPPEQDTVIGLLSCILVFGVELAGLSEAENPVWYPYIGSYLIALAFEPAILILSVLVLESHTFTPFQFLDICTAALRSLSLLLIVALYFHGRRGNADALSTEAERQALIQKDGVAGQDSEQTGSEDSGDSSSEGYGATLDGSTQASESSSENNAESPWERREREAREQMAKRLKENGNWFTYAKSFAILLPYIWPINNRPLQIRAVLVGVCLLTINLLNVLIPRQMGILMDSLSPTSDQNPWAQVMIFAALKFLASGAGIQLLRQWLWVPVEFYSYDAMSTAAYSHVLNLSSDFHDSKSSSDIMMAIQSGQSVSNMLESICFSAIPMLIDMSVAFVYLSWTFGPYEGLITIATSIIFMYIATRMIAGLRAARRREVGAFFDEHYVRQAGIQGWSTVTCFNQIGHEERRYSAAVKSRVSKSQQVYLGYLLAYAFQYLVLLAGLLAGAFLAVYQVTHDEATPGDFIMLLTYWSQLVGPLSFFASLGKTISRDLIHSEQLLEIMRTKPTVVNKGGAKPLDFVGGNVEFEHVNFAYDGSKIILKDINFSIEPGTTVAFVGATGAGKSTILKLLDRFYDVSDGAIKIDGQDIRDVDLYSLRGQIGVVPQSPILFDDTVINNVRYANLSATDEDVFEACKAASIHEQIMGFTEGYNTRVGERGIKLSGGELQRVAIARAILKRPAIVLLDEATSSVDTETEQKIQEALRKLCDGRTTLVVAHRLSTIMNADRIIVVAGGEIIEQGNHDSLIGANGKYAELWSKQIFTKPKDKAKDDPIIKGEAPKAQNIVNDLTSEETSAELAKVKSTPTANVESGSESSSATETEEASGHKKEGSQLNPRAPAFTPRSAVGGHSAQSCVAHAASRSTGSETIQTVVPAPPSQYVVLPVNAVPVVSVLVNQQDRSRCTGPARMGTNSTISHQAATEPLKAQAAIKALTTPSRCVELKHPRYSRRVQSKSEPSAGNDAE